MGKLTKPEMKAYSPVRDILVLGGRALEVEAARSSVDFCACDFVSTMGARPFSDYRAVVYWPDTTALELPLTYPEWRTIQQQHQDWEN